MIIVFCVYAVRAPEWTKGISSTFIVYGDSTAGTSGPNRRHWFPRGPLVPLVPPVLRVRQALREAVVRTRRS
jgi:hypothetical protein